VTVSVYNRLSWSYNFVYRSSQHAVLSSNTLGQLYDVIYCPSNELPDESTMDETFIGYQPGPSKDPSGCAVVIEGIAYGDGLTENDYARYALLLSKCELLSVPICILLASLLLNSRIRSPSVRKSMTPSSPHSRCASTTHTGSFTTAIASTSWSLTKFGTSSPLLVLTVSLNCSHSLFHSHDPPSGYPLTTQLTPPLIGNCRACSKVPGVYSIVGDMRLGESPCILCAPCWKNMGMPKGKEAEAIMVIPLPKYEFGC